MFWIRRTHDDKIFISYRRSDAQGYAGRLADSLEDYFGTDRIFRDVGSIEPGADFTERVGHTLRQAGACLVLIGPRWLVSEDGSKSRLHDPDDYVAGEIAAALESQRPVFPILVEGATMPRADDLPERLSGLVKRNAVTITDERWQSDVTRLARVLALDVSGSTRERRLTWVKSAVLAILTVAMLSTTLLFRSAVNECLSTQAAPACVGDARALTTTQEQAATTGATEPNANATATHRKISDVFTPGRASISFVAVVVVLLALMLSLPWVAPDSRRLIWATIWVGAIGTAASFLFYNTGDTSFRPVVDLFAASTCLIGLMLALLAMSGFKPNDKVA